MFNNAGVFTHGQRQDDFRIVPLRPATFVDGHIRWSGQHHTFHPSDEGHASMLHNDTRIKTCTMRQICPPPRPAHAIDGLPAAHRSRHELQYTKIPPPPWVSSAGCAHHSNSATLTRLAPQFDPVLPHMIPSQYSYKSACSEKHKVTTDNCSRPRERNDATSVSSSILTHPPPNSPSPSLAYTSGIRTRATELNHLHARRSITCYEVDEEIRRSYMIRVLAGQSPTTSNATKYYRPKVFRYPAGDPPACRVAAARPRSPHRPDIPHPVNVPIRFHPERVVVADAAESSKKRKVYTESFPPPTQNVTAVNNGQPQNEATPLAPMAQPSLRFVHMDRAFLPPPQPIPADEQLYILRAHLRLTDHDPLTLADLTDPHPPNAKPDYPYHHLMKLAIFNAPGQRLTRLQICDALTARFVYFREHTTWKNAVVHTLSLHNFLLRVDRPQGDPGTGDYWMLNWANPNGMKRKRKRNRKSLKQLRAEMKEQLRAEMMEGRVSIESSDECGASEEEEDLIDL